MFTAAVPATARPTGRDGGTVTGASRGPDSFRTTGVSSRAPSTQRSEVSTSTTAAANAPEKLSAAVTGGSAAASVATLKPWMGSGAHNAARAALAAGGPGIRALLGTGSFSVGGGDAAGGVVAAGAASALAGKAALRSSGLDASGVGGGHVGSPAGAARGSGLQSPNPWGLPAPDEARWAFYYGLRHLAATDTEAKVSHLLGTGRWCGTAVQVPLPIVHYTGVAWCCVNACSCFTRFWT